jgi:hypothetical protein
VVSFTPQALNPPPHPRYSLDRLGGSPRVSPHAVTNSEKKVLPCWESNHGLSVRSLVTILAELPRLLKKTKLSVLFTLFCLIYLLEDAKCRTKKGEKGKVVSVFPLTEHHAMKAYWGNGGTAPPILWPRYLTEVSGQLHAPRNVEQRPENSSTFSFLLVSKSLPYTLVKSIRSHFYLRELWNSEMNWQTDGPMKITVLFQV